MNKKYPVRHVGEYTVVIDPDVSTSDIAAHPEWWVYRRDGKIQRNEPREGWFCDKIIAAYPELEGVDIFDPHEPVPLTFNEQDIKAAIAEGTDKWAYLSTAYGEFSESRLQKDETGLVAKFIAKHGKPQPKLFSMEQLESFLVYLNSFLYPVQELGEKVTYNTLAEAKESFIRSNEPQLISVELEVEKQYQSKITVEETWNAYSDVIGDNYTTREVIKKDESGKVIVLKREYASQI